VSIMEKTTRRHDVSAIRRVLAKGAVETDRRTFLRRSTAATFTLFAAAAVGAKPAFALPPCAQYCTGPNGSGYCGADNCSGNHCTNQCSNVVGFCGSGGSCWGTAGGLYSCCDCGCASGTRVVYCFCCGNQ
jgi:hypothetical protein